MTSKKTSLTTELPLVRCASFRGYRDLVASLGGDAEAYLAQAGLCDVDIDNEEALIPTHCLCNALEIASKELGVTDFGLQLSLRQDLDVLGAIAILVQNATSLNEIIEIMTRHLQLIHNQSEQLSVSVDGNLLYLKSIKMIPNAINDVQITLLGFGFAARMGQKRLEPGIIARGIYFTHPKPENYQRYRDVFKTDIHFNQTFNGAVIDGNILRKDYSVKHVNVSHLEFLVLKNQEQKIHLSQQLGLLITQTLSSSEKGLSYYAPQLQMSERTLQRRLSAEGKTFKGLVEQIRKEAAKRYLNDQYYNMAQISELLGFSDQAVFTRAFKRWYGMTPKNYSKTISNLSKD